ncbi:MAG: glycogen debranching enzyme GlgX, partial [Propionibacteriales bacterium]|nr:glycogen debranching enzyme GlgX [Propionibacteriales bacterium]
SYANFSGCGNTLRSDTAPARDLILSSLRHWAREYGVDGFRFDLASTLARNSEGTIVYAGSLVEAIAQDEELAALKLIVEPWDASVDGYALGGFGGLFAEWNDRFRDDVRDYWRGTSGGVHRLASRLAGSSDLFADRSPMASINFVTAHDGFSLRDLVTYGSKHNDPNGENGRDGHNDNRSDGCGAEGETNDRAIIARRQQRARNLLSTAMLSLGVPMIRMGDEFGHTQGGNNNAYCQDNEISWIHWTADEGWNLCDHIAALSALRRDNPEFRRDFFLTDSDATWLRHDDTPMTDTDWADGALTFLGMSTGQISLRTDSRDGSFSLVRDAGRESLLNLHP